ncbi:PHD finger-like domain-containing protein 5B, partial [Cucurbita argyrosperma subsp. argyrosperma]
KQARIAIGPTFVRSVTGSVVICDSVCPSLYSRSDAYYCKECTQQEKDRDGCPKIVNLGSAKTDLFYERKKYGFKKRYVLFFGSVRL